MGGVKMSNGQMLDELRQIATGEARLSQKAMSQLTLAAIAEVILSQQALEAKLNALLANPLVRLGGTIQAQPKKAAMLGLLLLALFNSLGFLSEFWRPMLRAALLGLGFPAELMEVLP
jgi:hypothetical protein